MQEGAFLILQVDNPVARNLDEVLKMENVGTRVRVNAQNLGVSATRNRGLQKSLADLVLFFDDDVLPEKGAVSEMRKFLAHCTESDKPLCGAVGRTCLPLSKDIWHEATRMSYILTAFDWPSNVFPEVWAPWGVTANLCLRRADAVDFDTGYAHAGGGEDVDFCLRVMQGSGRRFGRCVRSRVVHSFWPRRAGAVGTTSYLIRFWKWTQSDGLLLDRFPHHVYLNWPNVIELTAPVAICLSWRALAVIWAVELLCETASAWQGPFGNHLSLPQRLVAALFSGVVKNVVDCGHAFYWIRRGRIGMICHRFDWYTGLTTQLVVGERHKFFVRTVLWVCGLYVLCV